MTTYNTGNPLGSSAAKDLYDNSQNLDHLSLDQENETWPDRLGKKRLTWHGMEERYKTALASLGLNPVGTFQDGATVTAAGDIIQDESTGVWYRWDDLTTLPKTVPTGSTPASSGGTGAGKWLAVDVSGKASLSMLEQGISVQKAMDYLLDQGTVVKLSTYHMLGLDGDALFSAALAAAKDTDGYAKRIIINDTSAPIEITSRHVFQSASSAEVFAGTYNGNMCGVIGSYKLSNGGGFDFVSCYAPYINVTITDGGGNVVNTITPETSATAIRMEGDVIAPEFHIVGFKYGGYLFGTYGVYNSVTMPGVQSMKKGSIAAFNGEGGAFYIANTTGFGRIESVWEETVTKGSSIVNAFDVSIEHYENYIETSGEGVLYIKGSAGHFTGLYTGAWGQPQVKIFDSTIDIDKHLCIGGTNGVQTQENYAMDIGNSFVSIRTSNLSKNGAGFRVGFNSVVSFGFLNALFSNQVLQITNTQTYDGTSTGTGATVTIASGNYFRGNNSNCVNSKHGFYVDGAINAGKLSIKDFIATSFNYGKTSGYARLLQCLAPVSGTFLLDIDGVRVDAFVGTPVPLSVFTLNSIIRLRVFGSETEFGTEAVTTTGGSRRARISSGLSGTSGTSTTYSYKVPCELFVTATIASGGYYNVTNGNSDVVIRSAIVGQTTEHATIYPGETYTPTFTAATLNASWRELMFAV